MSQADNCGPIWFWRETEVPHGYLSQWYLCEFSHEGVTYTSTEQWMMSQKAAVFNDMEIAKKIAATNDPREQKALGRKVKNFDGKKWDQHKYDIVEKGNYLKFTQSASTDGTAKPLKTLLLETGDRELVEASPFDRIWGIGFTAADAPTTDRALWGENLLGKALIAVRERLKRE